MKPLILSFFLVILGFSLFTNKEKEIETPNPELEYPNHHDIQTTYQNSDSIVYFWDKSVLAIN